MERTRWAGLLAGTIAAQCRAGCEPLSTASRRETSLSSSCRSVVAWHSATARTSGVRYNIHGPLDGVLEALMWIFVRGKGFGLFSLLFGLSFTLQLQRAARRDPTRDFRPRFAWRLVVLFAIGWLHNLVYPGDILSVYAVLGLPLVLLSRVPDRWLLVLALPLMVGTPRVVERVALGPTPTAEQQAAKSELESAAGRHWRALRAGDVAEIVRFHAGPGYRAKWQFQFGPMGRGYQTFGLFLLGMWAGRPRVFEDLASSRALFTRLARVMGALALGIPLLVGGLALIGRALGGGAQSGSGPEGSGGLPDFSSWPVILGLCVFDAWNGIMTLFYVAAFALLFLRLRWQRFFLRFAPVGRAALSTYLTQTLTGSLVFFGFGLGLLGRFGNAATLPLGLVVFAGQVWLCRRWLSRYRFGPVEWLWRSLTWFRLEPFRRRPPLSVDGAA